MTQDELKLVLDALKWCHGGEPCGTAEAIAVVEKALAQPEQFCDANCVWTDHHPDCKLAQPQQEPVAWMYQEYRDDDQFGWRDEILFTPPPNDPIYFRNITPLYTHPPQRTEQEPVALPCCGYADSSAIKWNPYNKVVQCHNCGQTYTTPPQRTWVGLTDEEIDSCFEDHGWSPSKDYYPVIKDIEAKLKEFNT
jgi:hypothetical protein